VSFDAIRWALAQDVGKSSTKFVLVAMAEHVNAEAKEWACWPSYRALAAVTLQDTKTVEAAVHRLKELGFIVDTGQRKGETRKVIVYRLNDPKCGGITPGLQPESANGTRPQNDPENGGVTEGGNPPKFPPNPPKFPGKSPQISVAMTPKTGDGTSNGIRKGTRKEADSGAAAPSIPGVPAGLLADWLKVRKDKRAGPITETVVACLEREAKKAGLSLEEAVRYCCEAAWQNFNAGFYAKREGRALPTPIAGKHAGLSEIKYSEGVNADGSFA
jgi:hypothetical protein